MARKGDVSPADGLPAELRRQRMLAAVKTREFMTVTEIGAMFGISEVTVRSDLDALADRGELRRVRGGALPLANPRAERSFEDSSAANAEEKAAIGRAAAEMIATGDTLILDVGTTAMAIATALSRRDDLDGVTVVTNGLNVALELERATPRLTVIVSGGTLRPLQHSLVNPLAEVLLAGIYADIAFVGCNGVHTERGITNINVPEAEVKRRVLAAARRKVVVADGSKIGEVAVARLCDVTEIDLLMTGTSARQEELGALKALGVDVHVAV